MYVVYVCGLSFIIQKSEKLVSTYKILQEKITNKRLNEQLKSSIYSLSQQNVRYSIKKHPKYRKHAIPRIPSQKSANSQ